MLKPEVSIGVGLATAAVVYGVYSSAVPKIADTRSLPSNTPDVTAAERQAAWMSAAVVGAVSLIAKDPTVFILGGSMVVALSWWNKHANVVNPEFGVAVPKGDNLSEQFDESSMADAENYANDNTTYNLF
jgi:hypothetical protein